MQTTPLEGDSKWCHRKFPERIEQERKQKKQQRKTCEEDTERGAKYRKNIVEEDVETTQLETDQQKEKPRTISSQILTIDNQAF